ncbi:thioredoxin [Paenibacillus gansuensis]|uniref:Thioredoxin n=1 Tax=Paenibacillus gansuensis TaxID=306542 RepID=A0ABW5PIP3_9BACL
MTIRALSDQDFSTALPADGLALVDFTAAWCPPCKVLLPQLEELQQELEGHVTMYKVDVDQAQETAAAFGVMSMPTVLVFRDGVPVDKLVGLRPKAAYRAVLARYM